jgi:cytochrome P450
MIAPAFPALSLAHRAELFERLRALPPGTEAYRRCTFDGRPGWIVSRMPAARSLLTTTAGRKARPEHSQRLLGGVGALRGAQVRQVKRQLVDAMAAEAVRQDDLTQHLRGSLADGPPAPGPLTEALSAAMLAQLTGQTPGSVDSAGLRRLVFSSWAGLEGDHADGRLRDDLAEYIAGLVRGSESTFLKRLRDAGWSTGTIAEELRGMVLAGWGSTTAATLSTLALGVSAPPSRAAVDEVLRLYPPSFLIARIIVEPPPHPLPFALDDVVLISPWLIHRDPAGWSAAQRFDPGRWRQQWRDRWFLPFGLGPRRCPAATFARAQIATAIEWYRSRLTPPIGSELSLVESRSPALVPQWSRA